jgi:hypothetical protein
LYPLTENLLHLEKSIVPVKLTSNDLYKEKKNLKNYTNYYM